MQKDKSHIFFFLLMVLLSIQYAIAFHPIQEQEQKREFDYNFKERYSNDKYNYEGQDIVGKSRMGSGEYEDYDKQKVKTREQNISDEITISTWVYILILIGAVLYLVYILISEGGTGLFTRGKNHAIDRFEDITAENIEHADIHTLIKQAEDNKDYRLAVRYYYLLTLKTLSLKNHIKFEDDKTNAEYLNEISEKPFSEGFSYASYLYNYIWYGKFNVEKLQYSKAKDNFTTLLNQVK